MRKNNFHKMLFILGACLSVLLIGNPQNEVSAAGTAESNATIEFEAPTDTPELLNPEDGSISSPPQIDDGNKTGQSGPLTLDYVSNFEFGIHDIQIDEQIYESETMSPFIQVTDRRGTGAGWEVTAQASRFTDGVNNSLPGATLKLTNGEAITNLQNITAPVVNQSIELRTGGEATKVVTANENEGIGSWATRWFPTENAQKNDHATLTIPQASASPGQHTSIITWTLTDAPGQ